MAQGGMFGESVQSIDALTLSTPLGLIHVWEIRNSPVKNRFFVSLNWKITQTTFSALCAFELTEAPLWRSEAIRNAKQLSDNIKNALTALRVAEETTRTDKSLFIARAQSKIDAIHQNYSEPF